jgi:hypothetical protein
MQPRSRRTQLVVPVLALALALAACGPDDDSPSPSVAVVETPPAASPTGTVSSTSPEPAVSAPGEIGQTDTDWGRIWDALPAGFPRYPGGIAADDASPQPVSAAYAIADGDPAQIAEWMQTSLELATYSTEGLSGPLEDGSFVLDSVGDDDCRIQTRIAPQGTLILVTVRYGADCPA